MRWSDLVRGLPGLTQSGDGDPNVTDIEYDSRKVKKGDLFVALKGQKEDGHRHIARAIEAGAVAVLCESSGPLPVPVGIVPSTLAALSPVAARFFGYPSDQMTVIGVTGTNGKTTITYMLESILSSSVSCGVIGTLNYRWKDTVVTASNTTPLSLDLQRILCRMKDEGVTHVVMEVSSHALALNRVEDVSFDIGIFTNLTRDHLDYHKTLDGYFEAKSRLFELIASRKKKGIDRRCAVLNRDDERYVPLSRRVRVPIVSYGLNPLKQDRADRFFWHSPGEVVGATEVHLSFQGTRLTAVLKDGPLPLSIRNVGLHNVYNALAASAAAAELGIGTEQIRAGLEKLVGVPGRLESVVAPPTTPFAVLVDYAHTDDALKNVLTTLRPLTEGRLIVVFGCGGDRDRTKRPLMGQTAVGLSDHVIVTSDNPRTEDPSKIVLDIEVGIKRAGGSHYEIIVDRRDAIRRALTMASKGDIVLLAGKGHETYQIFSDRTIPFDDRQVAREVLQSIYS
ncbi:MAG TPA: UDP-N-acetylmuramoyl-L-alanyl-D-glutamate--2,6-diaminopimelate ligase [Elusimicrobiota bacterium]|nr:UDP-N-acetylmuramoyl-L-alanyl-D-glutamate--2,6-diaminopimelate ligase [Elusimicrobiota bacterium]